MFGNWLALISACIATLAGFLAWPLLTIPVWGLVWAVLVFAATFPLIAKLAETDGVSLYFKYLGGIWIVYSFVTGAFFTLAYGVRQFLALVAEHQLMASLA